MNFPRIVGARSPFTLMVLFVLVLPMASAQTVGVWYQPTPAPMLGGTVMNGKTPHVVSGWLGSNYYPALVQDNKLQAGGWGDGYKMYSTPNGKVPVLASASGRVEVVTYDPKFNGYYMVIRHYSNGINGTNTG